MNETITLNTVTAEILIAALGMIFSVITSVAVVSMRWQRLTDKVDNIESDLKEIKGMFKMTLKE